MSVMAQADTHLFSDATYRAAVSEDFAKRQALISNVMDDATISFATLHNAEREAMEFLYAYMPYNDMADYSFDFFLSQVRYALRARTEMPWGKDIPEDVFRHFVLPYRVNNENLDSARMVFYPILKERLQGLSMYDAALEVNHWCHEYVTYRPADARTSAPLATMRTGLGRCGEESTFTVTALRAAGIPARQCYTPPWAQCDDYHATVEDRIDGEWMFLGACEPDPELNMGWFSIPSTRCMMVHTKAFGRYQGSEKVVKRTPLYSELNLLDHYSPARQAEVTVRDADGKPLPNVDVKFKLYNYAEYYTLASTKTDADGTASVITGMGDLLVWATDGQHYAYGKLDMRVDSTIALILNRVPGTVYVDNLDMVPPTASRAKVSPSKQKVIANSYRLAYEDSVRNARMSRFMINLPRNEWNVLPNDNLNEQQLTDIIRRAEGNHAEIAAFLNKHTKSEEGLFLYDYLRSYSDKDLRDITADMLEHHLTRYADKSISVEVYKKGIMPARISNEIVSPWRDLKPYVAPQIDLAGNYYGCPITPAGVARLKLADPHSRDIYFVAACRANNIPTYLDNATNEIYQWNDGQWQLISLDESEAPGTSGTLTLTYSGQEPKKPIYYPHFTLQRYEQGDFTSFDFEGDPRMDSFPATLQLPSGYYCLSTGNRYPSGEVLSRLEFFTIEPDAEVTKEITIRPLQADKAATYPSVPFDTKVTADSIILSNYLGVKGILFVNLGDYREPGKHLVNELSQLLDDIKAWGGNIYVLAPNEARAHIASLPNIDIIPVDNESADPLNNAVCKALDVDSGSLRYPLAAFVSPLGQILLHTEGYSIGSAEQLLKVARAY